MSTMINILTSTLLVTFILNVFFGYQVRAVPYDYAYTHECLAKPLAPQYGGGVVVNPELSEGLKGWTAFGGATVQRVESHDGNKYIVSSDRQQPFHSFSQKFYLEKEKIYTFSAWLQVSHGNADIAAVFETHGRSKTAGWVTARKGCWSLLKGGLVVSASGLANLYFQSNNTEVDIWADSISLQPFTQEEWKSHQHQSIEKVRKRRVKFQVMDQHGRPIPNATVSITQTKPHFPLGCAINYYIVNNTAYQNWFASRFKYTVFDNEMKWYFTERSPGKEDYSVADAMVSFSKAHGVSIRGHAVFWADPKYQPSWVGGLSSNALRAAADRRLNSVVSRYKGQVIHWDVMNENLHYSFFESKLGPNASTVFHEKANRLDERVILFLNEFNTIEESSDGVAAPTKYLQKVELIRQQGYSGPLGIGLQGHFRFPNLPYMRSGLDTLASAKLPVWITEFDVKPHPDQAAYLDQILRELLAHPTVQGIMVWSGWSPQGCSAMCLTDKNFKNLETGDVVDKVLSELSAAGDTSATTDSEGFFEASLFHGEYEAMVSHPSGDQIPGLQKFNVLPNEGADLLHFKI